MLNPTGDAPWEEDPNAKDVLHINTEKVNLNLQHTGKTGYILAYSMSLQRRYF